MGFLAQAPWLLSASVVKESVVPESVSPVEEPYAGRTLPDPGFAGDDGAAPTELTAALVAGGRRAVVAALLSSRVLVPVVPVLGEVEVGADGLVRDKTADMAVVTVRAPSGRLALPVFSSTDALDLWKHDARPVPVAGVLAARAAFDEGADTLLIDAAGPARVVLDGAFLLALANGRMPEPSTMDPETSAAVYAAVTALGLRGDQVVLEPGDSIDLVVRLTVASDVTDEDAAEVARGLAAALRSDVVVGSRSPRGWDLVVERAIAE